LRAHQRTQLYHLEDLRENYWHNMVNRIKNAYYTFKNFHGDCVSRIKLAFRVWKSYREEMLVIIQRAYREFKNLSPFYDFRMDNEKVMNGNKQRNRLSMASVRKFYGDYLDMRNQRALLDAMGPGASNEKVIFSFKCKTVVHPGFLGSPKLSLATCASPSRSAPFTPPPPNPLFPSLFFCCLFSCPFSFFRSTCTWWRWW
jgi:hypothetical protein